MPDQANQEKHHAYFNQEFHGTNGPIDTIYPPEYAECNKYWHATLNSLGINTNRSHLSGSNVGCWTSLAAVNPKFSAAILLSQGLLLTGLKPGKLDATYRGNRPKHSIGKRS